FLLQTPCTSAPNALAICTANVPTPPEAPLIRTLYPALTWPVSRRPCKATSAVGTDAACSKLRLLGLETTAPSRLTQMYWARAPALTPKTSSPGTNSVTFTPTASTVPEKSDPGIVFLGLRSPKMSLPKPPCSMPPSKNLRETARTRTRIWLSLGTGFSTSSSFRTSLGGPYSQYLIAFIRSPPGGMPRAQSFVEVQDSMKTHPHNATKIVSKLHFRIFLIFIGLTNQAASAGNAFTFAPRI